MELKTFHTFWIYKSRKDKKGNSPIYMRITVDLSKVEIPTGIKLLPKDWDSDSQRVKPKSSDASLFNQKLSNLRDEFNLVYRTQLMSKVSYTPETIRKRMLGQCESEIRTLIEAIVTHSQKNEGVRG